ncbi:MAG: hypothetical protein H7Z40_14805, partial [Phycisphaerae bacterium]|nr:hypothetical protein [Gemmatimonadaceae bacterium]
MINEFCRAAARLIVVVVVVVPVPAVAQNGSPTARNQGSGDGNAAPYSDVLIDGGRLEPDIWTGEVSERDASGWPRGLRLDAIYSNAARGG